MSKIKLQEKVFLSGLINDLSQNIFNLKNLKKYDSLNLFSNGALLDAFKHDSITENKEFSNLVTTKQLLLYNIDNTYSTVIINGTRLKQNLIEYLDTK